MLRDVCFNTAIWSFCFRYWNIANVMPKTVKAEPISVTYRVVSTILLVIGLIFNIYIPICYGVFGYKINSGYVHDPPNPDEIYQEYRKKYITSKYMVGALQLISAFFMLYAIVKIWFILRSEITMREFFS